MNKNERNSTAKYVAKQALLTEYGFAPAQANIILLELSGDFTYIRFAVGTVDNVYVFNSYKVSGGGVWIGKGTITRDTEV